MSSRKPLNGPQFQPFVQCLLNELMVGLRNFELFSVNRILCFEVNFVLEIFRKTQVVFVDAESALMFAQDIQIAFMELLWNLEVAPPSDFIPG